jgi:3-deoxy-D-manno-octulosonic-acid transferase
MYFVYSLLLTLTFLVLLPHFLIDAVRHGKYVAGFRERFGKLAPFVNDGKPVLWLHCVSVGESQAARPLVQGIRKRFPDHTLVVSTTTLTGQNLAHEIFGNDIAKVFYFPFDWRWTVRRTLNVIKPSIVLVMETEIWPGFLRECREAQVPVAIVNGRLSRQSLRRYKWIKGFMSRVVNCLSLAVMQTEADAERIHLLGLPGPKVFVSGNLKFDAGSMPVRNSLASEFRQRFKLTEATPLILAASTHAPEERLIIKVFQELRTESTPTPRLLMAPRHPERFAEVSSLLATSGLAWVSRSSTISTLDRQCDVILLDTIGELQALYPLASIVFVGGSIAKSGGHNILEPAAVGAAIVTGAHTHNFDAIVKAFVKERAIIQLPSLSDGELQIELKRVLTELLADSVRRQELGQRARTLVEQNLGATERTLALLDGMISGQNTPNRRADGVKAEGVYTA